MILQKKQYLLFYLFAYAVGHSQVNLYVTDINNNQRFHNETKRVEYTLMRHELKILQYSAHFLNQSTDHVYQAQFTITDYLSRRYTMPEYVEGWQEKKGTVDPGKLLVMDTELWIRPLDPATVGSDSFMVEAYLRFGPDPVNDKLEIDRFTVVIHVIDPAFPPPWIQPEPAFTQGTTNTVRWVPSKGTVLQEVYWFDKADPTLLRKASRGLYRLSGNDTLQTVVENLSHSHTYGYFVKSVFDFYGQKFALYSDFIYSTQDAVPPAPVTQTQVIEKNYGIAWLTWTGTTDATSGVDRYRIYKGVDTAPERLVDSVAAASSQDGLYSWQDRIDSVSVYHYRVTAVDAAGNEGDGELSNDITFTDRGNPDVPDMPNGNGQTPPAAGVRFLRGVIDTLRIVLTGQENAVRFQSVRDSLRYFNRPSPEGMRVFDSGWLSLESVPADPKDPRTTQWTVDYTSAGLVDSNFVNGHLYYRRVIRRILAVEDTLSLGAVLSDCFPPDDVPNVKAQSVILDQDASGGFSRWGILLNWEPAMDAASGLKRYHVFRKIEGKDEELLDLPMKQPLTATQFLDSTVVENGAAVTNPIVTYRVVAEDRLGQMRPAAKAQWEVSQRALTCPDWTFESPYPKVNRAGPDTLFTLNSFVAMHISRFDIAPVSRWVVEINGKEMTLDNAGGQRLDIALSGDEVTRFRIRALYQGGLSSIWTSFKWVVRALNKPVERVFASNDPTYWSGNITLKWNRPSMDVSHYEIWRAGQNGDSVLAGICRSSADSMIWTDFYDLQESTGQPGDRLPVYEMLRYRIQKVNRFQQYSNFSPAAESFCNRPPKILSSAVKNENGGFTIQIRWSRPYPNTVRKNYSTWVRIYEDGLDRLVDTDLVANDDSVYTYRNALPGRNYIFRIRESVNDDALHRQSGWSQPFTQSLRELRFNVQAQPLGRLFIAWDRSKVDSLRIRTFLLRRIGGGDTLQWTYPNTVSSHMDSATGLIHGIAYQYDVSALDSLNQIVAAGSGIDTCDAGAAFIPAVNSYRMRYFNTPTLDVDWQWHTVSGQPALHTTRGARVCLIQVSLSKHFPNDTNQTRTVGPFPADPEKRSMRLAIPPLGNRENSRVFIRITANDDWGHPIPALWSDAFYGLIEASYDTVKPRTVADLSVAALTAYYKKSDQVVAALRWTSVGLQNPGEVSDRLLVNVDRYRLVRLQNNQETIMRDQSAVPGAVVYTFNDTIQNVLAKWKITAIDSAGNASSSGWIDSPSMTPTPPLPKPNQQRGCTIQSISASGSSVENFVEIAMRSDHFQLAYELDPGSVSERLLCRSGWFTGTEYACKTGWGTIDADTTHFRVKARIGPWESGWSSVSVFVKADPVSGRNQRDETPIRPVEFAISQNYPNPFNAETRMELQLPENSTVSIQVFSIHGARIRSLVDEEKPVGRHAIIWDGRQENGMVAASGIYIALVSVRSETGSVFQKRVKMVLLK